MAPKYQCPRCKCHLTPHWSEKENALGLGLGVGELVAYIVAFSIAGAGYFFQVWELVAAIGVSSVLAAWLIYRLYMRKPERFYCASCDKVFRGDYVRNQSPGGEGTEIAS